MDEYFDIPFEEIEKMVFDCNEKITQFEWCPHSEDKVSFIFRIGKIRFGETIIKRDDISFLGQIKLFIINTQEIPSHIKKINKPKNDLHKI